MSEIDRLLRAIADHDHDPAAQRRLMIRAERLLAKTGDTK
jgi:hypothetical protein